MFDNSRKGKSTFWLGAVLMVSPRHPMDTFFADKETYEGGNVKICAEEGG